MNDKYLIGSDPEIFIKTDDDELSSSIGIFKGTKYDPIDIGEGCAVQEDNILVEFNIPPVKTKKDFIDKINYSKSYIETVLAGLGKKVYYSSSEIATDKVLEDDQAHVFGCSPSYNVLSQQESKIDVVLFSEEESKIRSSGFHIHVGYPNPTQEQSEKIVLAFELFVTLPLLQHDNDFHNRRLLYGKIGDCRFKDYGVECRSLGGYFLKNDSSLSCVWDQIEKALECVDNDTLSISDMRGYLQACFNEDETINLDTVKEVLNYLEIKELKLELI